MRNGTRSRAWSTLYVTVPSLALAAFALCGAIALERGLVSRERQQLLNQTDEEARYVAAQLRSSVLQTMDVLSRIGNWWLTQGRPEAAEDWETDAQLFLKAGTGIRELNWVDTQGRTVWSVRPGALPNFKRRPQEVELVDSVRQAQQSGSLAFSKIGNSNGATHIYACVPIRSGRVVGFVVGLFDSTALVDSLLKDLPRDYELTIAVEGLPVTTLEQAQSPLWRAGSRTAVFTVANRKWSAQLVPAATDIQTLQRAVWGFGVVVSILLAAFTALALIYRQNELALAASNAALDAEMAQRLRAEKVIQQQVADFQTLVDVLPVGLAVSEDPDCRTIWVNPRLAAMLKVPRSQNISKSAGGAGCLPYKHVRNGVVVPAEGLPMQMAASTGKAVMGVELDIARDDGSTLNTLSYSVPVIDPDGNLRRIIHVCVDLTERKSLEERLVRAEKYRSLALMAGGVAHDFNNLLTAILGNAELAYAEVPPGSNLEQCLKAVICEANRAAELVGQLLAYTGHRWLTLQALNLSAEIQSFAGHLRGMTPNQVDVEFELATDLPFVRAGARELQHVLTNLMANAIEAIGEARGTVKIRAEKCYLSAGDLARDYPDQDLVSGEYVRLEISDSGAGVSSEVATQIFDPFFTTKFMGRGLGLSEVQGIMRAHHGGIRFDSSSANGTQVQAIFPAVSVRVQ
jgi:two-component system cell cycle sensor histidine kinase/response regulator CckA